MKGLKELITEVLGDGWQEWSVEHGKIIIRNPELEAKREEAQAVIDAWNDPIQVEYRAALEECYRKRTADLASGGYGTLEEQKDMEFHQGFEGWRAHIQAVKDKYPKPEVPA